MKNFRDLQVWQKSHRFTLDVYRATVAFPSAERFGLTQQLRRAASSIPANTAEGCGRNGDADFCRFLQIAMGSACESEYHLLLAHDLKLLNDAVYEELNEQVVQVKRMLASLLRKLRSDIKNTPKASRSAR